MGSFICAPQTTWNAQLAARAAVQAILTKLLHSLCTQAHLAQLTGLCAENKLSTAGFTKRSPIGKRIVAPTRQESPPERQPEPRPVQSYFSTQRGQFPAFSPVSGLYASRNGRPAAGEERREADRVRDQTRDQTRDLSNSSETVEK